MDNDERAIVNSIGVDLKTILSFIDFEDIEDFEPAIRNYLESKDIKCKKVTVIKVKAIDNDKRSKPKIILNIYLTIIKDYNIEIMLQSK